MSIERGFPTDPKVVPALVECLIAQTRCLLDMACLTMVFKLMEARVVKWYCSRILTAIWRIGCAWDALLAGDIEDIRQHIDYEAGARNLD
jgi:hypothetical protein